LAGCTSTDGSPSISGSAPDRGRLDPSRLALIAGSSSIGIAQGGSVRKTISDVQGASASAVGTDNTLAVSTPREIMLVDLGGGEPVRRPCDSCSAALVGDRVLAFQPDWTLLVFDRSLRLQHTIHADHVTEPRTVEFPSDGQTPSVLGVIGQKVAVGYL